MVAHACPLSKLGKFPCSNAFPGARSARKHDPGRKGPGAWAVCRGAGWGGLTRSGSNSLTWVSRRSPSASAEAFAYVSKLLSQCKFDLLEELVAKEVLHVLKEKVTSLPDNHKSALAADIDEIVYTSTGDISIYYDEKGRKFVNILMCFWYLTSANVPNETIRGASVFQVKLGDQNVETKQLLSASYEFQREFTQGVKPNWTIARIEHPKLLE